MTQHIALAALLAALVVGPAAAQTPREIMPPRGNYFGGDASQRGPDGRRLETPQALQDVQRRRDEAQRSGTPIAPAPRSPPLSEAENPMTNPAYYSRTWLGYIERAVANAPRPRGDIEADCGNAARVVLQCRLAQAAADGAAMDISCFGRHRDNRNWAEPLARERGLLHLNVFRHVCFPWLDVNQTAPMRR